MMDLDPLGPTEFTAFLAQQMDVWGQVVQEKAVRPN
jgi:hypothetical protein